MTEPMNILFLMTDQHNPDYVGYAGKGKAVTPNIDWIAEGVRFTRAVSPNPVCTPTRCALLTGKYPHQVGMMTMSGDLSLQHPTYPRALQKAGYQTAAIGKLHLLQGWHWSAPRGGGHNLVELKDRMRQYGFDKLWEAAGKGLSLKNYCDYCAHLESKGLLERYRDELQQRETVGHPESPDSSESFGIPESDHVEVVIADKIIETIRSRSRRSPFFIFGSFLSPHPIIDPPQRYFDSAWQTEDEEFLVQSGKQPLDDELKQRWIVNRRGYRALVHLVDDQIGRIIDALREEGLLDSTVIIYASDHGDMLGNFAVDGKNLPWRESATVPLAIRHPNNMSPQVCDTPVSLIDITATILDIAGLNPVSVLSRPWPAWNMVVPCLSLMPIIKGETDAIREFTFTENDGWEMIATQRYKYIRWRTHSLAYEPPRESLYDLIQDPNEIHDVASNPNYASTLEFCRSRREHLLNATPAGQIGWAPVTIRSERG